MKTRQNDRLKWAQERFNEYLLLLERLAPETFSIQFQSNVFSLHMPESPISIPFQGVGGGKRV